MRKLRFFMILGCLLATSMAFAATASPLPPLPENHTMFCFSGGALTGGDSLVISQKKYSEYNAAVDHCVSYWYINTSVYSQEYESGEEALHFTATFENERAYYDARSAIMAHLNNNSLASVTLATDLDFGDDETDYTSSTETCKDFADNNLSFQNQGLSFDETQRLIDAGNAVIKNVCYVAETSNGVSFLSFASNMTSYGNLSFDHIYFRLGSGDENNPTSTSVLGSITGYVHDISVKNSYFEADFAGALGSSNDSYSLISNITIEDVVVKGAEYAGAFVATASQADLKKITVKNADVSGNVAGGLMGTFAYDNDGEWSIDSVIVGTTSVHGTYAAGGLFGSISISSMGSANVHVTHAGLSSVSIDGARYMGGLVGYSDVGEQSNAAIDIHESSFEGSVALGCADNSAIGGVMGALAADMNGTNSVAVRGTGVKATIGSATPCATPPSTMSVGGLIGEGYGDENDGAVNISAKDNFIIGSILVPNGQTSSIGYLVGAEKIGTSSTLIDNYYYGSTGDAAVVGIGSMSQAEWNAGMVSGNFLSYNNFRNDNGGKLTATGTLDYRWTQKSVVNGTNVYANGILADATMKSDALPAIMNMVDASERDVYWTRTDDDNDGLPFFATAGVAPFPNWVVLFDLTQLCAGNAGCSDKIAALNPFEITSTDGQVSETSYYKAFYTTSEKKFSENGLESLVDAVTTALGAGEYYWNYWENTGFDKTVEKRIPISLAGVQSEKFGAITQMTGPYFVYIQQTSRYTVSYWLNVGNDQIPNYQKIDEDWTATSLFFLTQPVYDIVNDENGPGLFFPPAIYELPAEGFSGALTSFASKVKLCADETGTDCIGDMDHYYDCYGSNAGYYDPENVRNLWDYIGLTCTDPNLNGEETDVTNYKHLRVEYERSTSYYMTLVRIASDACSENDLCSMKITADGIGADGITSGSAKIPSNSDESSIPTRGSYSFEINKPGYKLTSYTVNLIIDPPAFDEEEGTVQKITVEDNSFALPSVILSGYDEAWQYSKRIVYSLENPDKVIMDSLFVAILNLDQNYGDLSNHIEVSGTFEAIPYDVFFHVPVAPEPGMSSPYFVSTDMQASKTYKLDDESLFFLNELYGKVTDYENGTEYVEPVQGWNLSREMRYSDVYTFAADVVATVISDGSLVPATETANAQIHLYANWQEIADNYTRNFIPANVPVCKSPEEDKEAVCWGDEDVFPGEIVLEQSLGETVFEHHANIVENEDVGGDPYLAVELLEGNLVNKEFCFDAKFNVDGGYAVKNVNVSGRFAQLPNEPEGSPVTLSYKLNDDDSQDTIICLNGAAQNVQLTVDIDTLQYVIHFAVPTDSNIFALDPYTGDNWIFAKEYTVISDDASIPRIASSEGCVAWSLDENGQLLAPLSGSNDEMNGGIGEVVELNGNVAKLLTPGENTLYPRSYGGEDCPRGSEVTNAKLHTNGFGTIVLTQSFGVDDEQVVVPHRFTPDDAGDTVYTMIIPRVNTEDGLGSISFALKAEPDSNYFLSGNIEAFYELLEEGRFQTSLRDGADFTFEGYTLDFYANFVSKGPYYVKYDLNMADEKMPGNLFIPSGMTQNKTVFLSERDSDGLTNYAELDKPFRNDSCFMGWKTLDNMFTRVDASTAQFLSKDSTEPTLLKAVWGKDKCATADSRVALALVSNEGEGSSDTSAVAHAKVKLVQTFGEKTIEHLLEDSKGIELGSAPEGYDVDVVVIPDPGYKVVRDTNGALVMGAKYRLNDGLAESMTAEGSTFKIGFVEVEPSQALVVVPQYYFAPQVTIADYLFTFNTNGQGSNVFFGSGWFPQGEYRLNGDSVAAFPRDAFRADACLEGWTFEPDGTTSYNGYDMDFMIAVRDRDVLGLESDTLYAVWDTSCVQNVVKVVSNNQKGGRLNLLQVIENDTISFEVGEEGLEVPYIDDGLRFITRFIAKFGWSLAEGEPVKLMDVNGVVYDSLPNGGEIVLNRSMVIDVEMSPDEYHLVFDAVNDDATIFYGDDWKSEGIFSLAEKSEIPLPAVLYTSGECLEGWTFEGAQSAYADFNEDMAKDMLSAYKDSMGSSFTVKPRWTDDLSKCRGDFTRIFVESEHGSIVLNDVSREKTEVHEFTKDGSMVLPLRVNGQTLMPVVEADSSFMMDSIVVTRVHEVGQEKVEERYTVYPGATLPFNLENVSLRVFYSKSNKTPVVVKAEFMQTGNAIKVAFETSAFEVTRGVDVSLKMIDLKDDSIVVDTLLGDSVRSAFADSWEMFPVYPGYYKVILLSGDSLEQVDTSFIVSVAPGISAVQADGWQMISLAAIDWDSLQWDDDIKFYWWNELSMSGKYWQYYELNPSDSIVDTRGYWYSSLEGRALPLRAQKDDGADVVWQLDSVYSGWNMVANPHGWKVNPYGDLRDGEPDFTEDTEMEFLHVDPKTGGYVPVLELEPYEAVWVQVEKPTKWTFSAKPVFKSAVRDSLMEDGDSTKALGKRNVLAKAVDGKNWRLQLRLSDASGKSDFWNMIGSSSKPFATEEPPENMSDHVNLSIVEGKKFLARSVKPVAAEQEWKLELSATSSRMGFLEVDGVDALRMFGLKVFVTVDGNTTEMTDGNRIQVPLARKSKFATVRVAPTAKTLVVSQLSAVRAVKAGSALSVTFNATEGLAGATSRVELFDMQGHVMATATAKTLAGSNQVTLDAPRPGLYMLRVRAGSQSSAGRVLLR